MIVNKIFTRILPSHSLSSLIFFQHRHFASTKIKTFSKQSVKHEFNKHEQDFQQKSQQSDTLRNLIIDTHTLPSLLLHKQRVFQQRKLLPLYLGNITKHITSQAYALHQPDFDFINEQLNNTYFQITITPLEYITILNYRCSCRQFEKKYSSTENFGFQSKATMVCASFIHKKQLDLNQSIFLLESLLRLGSMSVLLFMNFVKYIKGVFLQSNHQTKVNMEQIVTILNTNLLKRNQITLENILYDQVLNYLLNNIHSLIKSEGISMKVQILNILMVLDLKKFYKSNKQTKQVWTKKLLTQLMSQVYDSHWASQLLCMLDLNQTIKTEKTQQNRLNWNHILNLVESINFIKQNQFEQQCYGLELDNLFTKVHQTMYKAVKNCLNQPSAMQLLQKSQVNKQIIVRLLFNVQMLKRWLLNNQSRPLFEKFIINLNITREVTLYPMVDAINQIKFNKNDTILKHLLRFSTQLYCTLKKNNLIIWALAPQLIQLSTPLEGIKIINELSLLVLTNNQNQEHLLSYILFLNYCTKQTKLGELKSFQNLIKLLQQKLKNPKIFINRLHMTVVNFRNTAISCNILQLLMQSSQTFVEYLKSIKLKRIIYEEANQIFQLIFVTICNKGTERLDPLLEEVIQHLLKDQIKKHQFLASCYPQNFPHPKSYYKRTNILTDPSTFRQNFQIILTYFNDPRYSYFLWDLFIKNFVKLPRTVRQECFPLLEKVFMESFHKQNLRKVILLTVLTNHINSGIIIATKETLRKLFQTCIQQLLKAQQIIQYHYQCYVQVVINAISSDILSMDCFHLIIKQSLDKSPDLRTTTTLMLLYGATIIHFQSNTMSSQHLKMTNSQINYLKFLAINNKFIYKDVNSLSQLNIQSENQNKEIRITAKIIAIYMRFGLKEILKFKSLIYQFINQNYDITQWMMIAYCFSPEKYSFSPEERDFGANIAKVLSDRMIYFKQLGMLSEEHQKHLLKILNYH